MSIMSLLLLACQPAQDPQPKVEPVESRTQKQTMQDFTQMCQSIEQQMAEIDAQRTTLALEQIHQDLKICVPLMPHEQQHRLMQHAKTMYERFLAVERNPKQQTAFEQYALEMAQHPTIQQSHFVELHPRDQYLLKHKGQAYVELIDGGQKQLHYRQSPEFFARIFAPYLPEAEKVFIETLAKQNQQPVLIDNKLTIDAYEIVTRALTWQDYLKRFKQSPYTKDAKHLSDQYTVFLFYGSKAQPISTDYAARYAIDHDHLDRIIELSLAEPSQLQNQSQRFLAWLDMTQEQRQNALPTHLRERSAWEQVAHYAGINLPSENYTKECFKDSICRE